MFKPKVCEYTDNTVTFPLLNTTSDTEIRPITITSKKTEVLNSMSNHFEKFSEWKRLVETIARLKHVCKTFHNKHHSTDSSVSEPKMYNHI